MGLDDARIHLGRRAPTREEWEAELASGWPGSNGSSMSTDHICGVRIGITSADYDEADGPADHHDFGYRVLRRLLWFNMISAYEAELLRGLLDLQMRTGLLAKSVEARRVWRWSGIYQLRCFIRWRAVVRGGSDSIVPIPDKEQYLT